MPPYFWMQGSENSGFPFDVHICCFINFVLYRYSPVGRSFYSPNLGTRQPLGDGLESWRGFYQSIRPTQMGLSLNIGNGSLYIYTLGA